jgi:hypothetical protein
MIVTAILDVPWKTACSSMPKAAWQTFGPLGGGFDGNFNAFRRWLALWRAARSDMPDPAVLALISGDFNGSGSSYGCCNRTAHLA